MKRFGFLIFCCAFLLNGCYGRISDDIRPKISAEDYGLDGKRPGLIVFGAAWCKPCMSEIPALNRAQEQFKSDLQIVNLLVEGAQKGVPITASDAALFESPKGEKPQYALKLDPSWQLFDALKPQSGRALPTLVFVDRDQVVRIVQRSMDYESELLPALQSLISGQPESKPEDPPPVEEGVSEVMSFAKWSARPENAEGGQIYQNLHAAWQRGLEDFVFLEEEMPFSSARITALVYPDARTEPKSAVWNSSLTVYRHTVFLNADGSYARSEGICR